MLGVCSVIDQRGHQPNVQGLATAWTMTTEQFNCHVMSPCLGKVSLVVCLSMSFFPLQSVQTPGSLGVSKNNFQPDKRKFQIKKK